MLLNGKFMNVVYNSETTKLPQLLTLPLAITLG
jgi:hypothetical protein